MRIESVMQYVRIAVPEHASLTEAKALMHRRGIAHLAVVRGATLVGILTESDIGRAGASMVPASARYKYPALLGPRTVGEVMAQPVRVLTPQATVQEAARSMREEELEGIPIVENNTLIGQVTIRNLLDILIGALEQRRTSRFGEILVAIELGGNASNTITMALALARQHRARLTVLHMIAQRGRAFRTQECDTSAAPLAGIHERPTQAALEQLVARLPQDQAAPVVCKVVPGTPAAAIADTAARMGADLIVIGHGRQRWIRRLLRLSITEAVIRHEPCPVFAVRQDGRNHHASR
jgi:nucleotide-binding universal stress UspA family protein/CBS domain-containing protein